MNFQLHSQSSMLVIGHRGAMGYEVENSIASFKKAIEIGVIMIEIDVFQCKSGEIVVFHDEHLNRLTNKDALIESLTLEEINELYLSNGEKIPLLIEVLQLCTGKTKINIELKGENTAKSVAIILQDFINHNNDHIENYLISSFHWNELQEMRLLNSEIKLGVLTQIAPLKALETAKQLNAFSIHPRFNAITYEKVSKIHSEGFKVYAYTVKTDEDILKMYEFGVDGIFTNYPDRAINLQLGIK